MEIDKTNIPQPIEQSEPDVSRDQLAVPERVSAEVTSRSLGGSAIKSGNPYEDRVVVVNRGPGIPVRNPGPEAIRRAGYQTMIDGRVGYVLPGQSGEHPTNE